MVIGTAHLLRARHESDGWVSALWRPKLVATGATLGAVTPPDTEAVTDSLSRPERLAAHLRSAEVTGNSAALSGHLVGAELAAVLAVTT